jgi:hypothetical protein
MKTLVPLPLAPAPYRAEAMRSWLTRVATPYSMNPRQLLRALRIKPFDGPTWAYEKTSLESALDAQARNHLSRAWHAVIRLDSVTRIAGSAFAQSSMTAGSCSVPAVYGMTSTAV